MANFYIEKTDINENIATISGEEAQHISRVLRMKKGDEVTLCDGEGMFYEAALSDFSDKTSNAICCKSSNWGRDFSSPINVSGT